MKGVCSETKNRIRLSVAAYAYEFEGATVMSDIEFDVLSALIDPEFETGNAELDHFFWTFFEPHTGMWIRDHPEIEGLKRLYHDFYKKDDLI